jgi:hypothetical protein
LVAPLVVPLAAFVAELVAPLAVLVTDDAGTDADGTAGSGALMASLACAAPVVKIVQARAVTEAMLPTTIRLFTTHSISE